MRWALLIGLMFALIIIPFLIFEKQFEALGTWLAEGHASGWASASIIGGAACARRVPARALQHRFDRRGRAARLLARRRGDLDRHDRRLRDRVCLRRASRWRRAADWSAKTGLTARQR